MSDFNERGFWQRQGGMIIFGLIVMAVMGILALLGVIDLNKK